MVATPKGTKKKCDKLLIQNERRVKFLLLNLGAAEKSFWLNMGAARTKLYSVFHAFA